jgi:hypothetical protein
MMYKHETEKKELVVDFIYQFARIKDEIISFHNLMIETTTVVIKKIITIITKLTKKIKDRAALLSKTSEKMHVLKTSHVYETRTCENFDRYHKNNLENNQHYLLTTHHFVT